MRNGCYYRFVVKTILMKIYILFIIISTFLIGCNSGRPKFNYSKTDNPWIQAFKDKAFVSCLKESYSNDTIFALIEREDLFNPYDGFYTREKFVVKADSVGRAISKNLPPTNYKDYGKSNYYMATCLHYYTSKDLDSVARREFKKYIREAGQD